MSYIKDNWQEFSNIIDEDGILLDDNLNEIRDEEGATVYVSEEYWSFCKQISHADEL